MSVIDQLPPAKRRLTSPFRRDVSRGATAVLAWFAGLLARAWTRLRSDRPLRLALVWGIASWVILQFAFLLWVHRNLEGVSHRAFLPGTRFGVPEREAAAGMQGVCKTGYDGQQYYWQSNDIFARRDAYKHLDVPLYRYQRIGIPMLAGGLAGLLGYELTPPLLYHTLQFGLTSAAFGVLVYWLLINQLSPAYALGWLVSGGTIQSLWLGILDAPGDAFFVFTFVAIASRRLWLYVPLATMLLLTREGYIVYAFAVFMATSLTRFAWLDRFGRWKALVHVEWRDVAGYWKQVALTAVPGIVTLAWTAYLTIQLHSSPIAARDTPIATSWPYYMMVKYIKVFYRNGNWFELRLALVSAFTLVLVSVLLAKHWRRLPLGLACAIPYVLLTACLGSMVWEYFSGYMKSNGTIIIIGLLMLPIDKSILLRIMLALQAFVGVDLQSDLRIMRASLLSPHLVHEEAGYYAPNPPNSPENPVFHDLRSSVEWIDAESVCQRKYHGVWDRIHREVKPVRIAVTNHTDITWQPGFGKHPLWLGCVVYNDTGVNEICRHSVLIDQPIAPGETKEFTAYLELRRPGKKYVAEFSIWQDGPGWFVRSDPSFGRRYEFTTE